MFSFFARHFDPLPSLSRRPQFERTTFTVKMAGYLYMPLCACLSAVIFRRHYGWLEIHGLGFLTLSIMIFVELGARPWAQGSWGDIHISLYFSGGRYIHSKERSMKESKVLKYSMDRGEMCGSIPSGNYHRSFIGVIWIHLGIIYNNDGRHSYMTCEGILLSNATRSVSKTPEVKVVYPSPRRFGDLSSTTRVGMTDSIVLSMFWANWEPVHAPEFSESLGVVGMFWVSSCEFSMVLRQLMMDKVMNHTQTCVLKDMDFQSISGCAGWSMICLKYWTVIYNIYIYHDSWWNLRAIMHHWVKMKILGVGFLYNRD